MFWELFFGRYRAAQPVSGAVFCHFRVAQPVLGFWHYGAAQPVLGTVFLPLLRGRSLFEELLFCHFRAAQVILGTAVLTL